MDLSKIPTADLIQELSKREGVEKFVAEPYQPFELTVGDTPYKDDGPVIIFIIQD